MKRDLDLIRQILLQTENNPNPYRAFSIDIAGYDQLTVDYHVMLLYEAGYLKAMLALGSSPRPMRLTWAGHEFIDAARNETIWHKAKAKAESLGGAAFPVVLELLLALAKQQLGLP